MVKQKELLKALIKGVVYDFSRWVSKKRNNLLLIRLNTGMTIIMTYGLPL